MDHIVWDISYATYFIGYKIEILNYNSRDTITVAESTNLIEDLNGTNDIEICQKLV